MIERGLVVGVLFIAAASNIALYVMRKIDDTTRLRNAQRRTETSRPTLRYKRR